MVNIPAAWQYDVPTTAVKTLQEYFGDPYPGDRYTGAWFDAWDSAGTRESDGYHFTADDLVSIRFLSVDAGPHAARTLLQGREKEFSDLLIEVGPYANL